jgi:eukaryotic-like serine/threonine-protein kinase
VLAEQGKHDEAFATMRKVTELFGELYGDQPISSAIEQMGEADTAMMAGDFAKSASIERQRLVTFERVLGPASVEVAYTRSSLALSLELDGKLEEARAMRRRAISILSLDPTPRLAEELTSLGGIELDLGDNTEAIETMRRAVTLVQSFSEDPYGELATAQAGMGRGLVRLGRPQQAIAPLEAALKWREGQAEIAAGRLGAPRWFLAQALWDSGGSKARARALAKQAQANFEAAVKDLSGKPGPFHVFLQRTAALLADVKAWRAAH